MLRAPRTAVLLLPLVAACQKGDKVPSYVDIPGVTLTTTAQQGSATSKITDAWVYANEELIGVWELPARVPVLKEGPVEIRVTPAIKRNGMYDDRLRYPFFEPWKGTVDLVREGTATLQPVTSYLPQTTFWIEAFEDAGILLNVTPASDTTLLRLSPTTDPGFPFLDGTACGGFVLDQDRRYIRLYTNVQFEVYGGPVFLEMDYRNDVMFTVGALFTQGGAPQVVPHVYVAETVRSDGTMPWNKIYIDLSTLWNQGGISQRDFYIEANLPAIRTHGEVYFDNLKIVRITP